MAKPASQLAWRVRLQALDPCPEAVQWLDEGDYRTLQTAWDACERADWMLWLLGKQVTTTGSPAHRVIVRIACACAESVLHLVSKNEERPRKTVELAKRWADGDANVSSEDIQAAARAAEAAAGAAAWAAAWAASPQTNFANLVRIQLSKAPRL